LQQPATSTVTFDVFTTDGPSTPFIGAAVAGTNYVGITAGSSPSGTVTFMPGQAFATVTVEVKVGSFLPAPGSEYKQFTVNLSSPSAPTVAVASGTGLIAAQVPKVHSPSPAPATNLQVATGRPTGTPGGVYLSNTSQLSTIVAAAEARWVADGVSKSAFQGVQFRVANMGGGVLANTVGKSITIDSGAAGFGWFVDPTPMSDGEYAFKAHSSDLVARAGTLAAGHMDLLTVVEHELGHILGIADSMSGPDNLMTQGLSAGMRRLPDKSLLSAVVGPVTHVTPGVASVSGINLTELAKELGVNVPTINGKVPTVSTKALDRVFAEWTNIPAGVKTDVLDKLFATLGVNPNKK
jgi:hypothetical protein